MTNTAKNAIAAGSRVTANGGKPATVVSIKGRWVRVKFDHDGSEKNVGFKDVTPANTKADDGTRKNGCVKAEYLSNYQRVKLDDGSVVRDNGDDAAALLRGMELDDVYKTVAHKLGVTVKGLHEQYDHLNVGMQRMNLGNRLRKALRDADSTE